MINTIVTEVFNFNIYEYYLSTNCGTLVVFIAQTVYALHHSKYIAICRIDVMNERFILFLLLTSIINKTHQVKYAKRLQGCSEVTGLGSSSQAVTLKAKVFTVQ